MNKNIKAKIFRSSLRVGSGTRVTAHKQTSVRAQEGNLFPLRAVMSFEM